METEQRAKELEKIGEAAARLLRRLNARRKRPVAESATRIQDLGHEAPVVIEVAEGAAEVCAPFGGFWGLVPANDNKTWQGDFGDRDRVNRIKTAAAPHRYPRDSAGYRACGIGRLLGHRNSDKWDY